MHLDTMLGTVAIDIKDEWFDLSVTRWRIHLNFSIVYFLSFNSSIITSLSFRFESRRKICEFRLSICSFRSLIVSLRFSVSFFSLEGDLTGLTLRGFKYPLNKYHLKVSDSGLTVSNEIADDEACVEFDAGSLLMLMTRDWLKNWKTARGIRLTDENDRGIL